MYFIQQRIKFSEGLTQMVWFLLVLSFDITHTDKHAQDTQGPKDLKMHANITWQHPLCAHDSYLHYTEWITCWYKSVLYRGPQFFYISNITHLTSKLCQVVEVTYLLIRFNKTQCFLRNTKKTDRNGIIEQKTHTTHREKDKFRKGQLVLFSDTTFFRTTPLFYQTLNFYGTILNAPFLGKVRKLKLPSPSLSGMRGGLQLWLPHPPTQILGN